MKVNKFFFNTLVTIILILNYWETIDKLNEGKNIANHKDKILNYLILIKILGIFNLIKMSRCKFVIRNMIN